MMLLFFPIKKFHWRFRSNLKVDIFDILSQCFAFYVCSFLFSKHFYAEEKGNGLKQINNKLAISLTDPLNFLEQDVGRDKLKNDILRHL